MSLILTQKITGPAAWKGSDFPTEASYVQTLTPAQIAELDQALATVKQRGLGFPGFGKDDFPLDTLRPVLDGISEELENGRGFALLRGLPVARYSDEEVRILYYGMGLQVDFEIITATVSCADGSSGTGYSYTIGWGGHAIKALPRGSSE